MAADKVAQIESLVKRLEEVRQRPWFWLGRIDPELAKVFLLGIDQSMEATGFGRVQEVRWQVERDRGWDQGGARGPISHMKREGLTDEAIVDELMAIEIEVWNRIAAGQTDE
jgi:hypothetical protein